MQRVFQRDVGRWKAGEIRDYPLGVWRDIARDAHADLDTITKTLEEAVKPAPIKRGGWPLGKPRKEMIKEQLHAEP